MYAENSPLLLETTAMPIHVIINQIIVLFLLMGLGYVLAKHKILESAITAKLTWLLCYLIMPCLIVNAFQMKFSAELMHNFLLMFALTVGIHIGYILVSQLLLNRHLIKPQELIHQLRFTSIYSNCGFMGIPLVLALTGSAGIFYGSVYIAVNGLFLWTHGILSYTGKVDRKSLLKTVLNANTLAFVIGVVMFLTSLQLPTALHDTLKYLANMNTALSMLVVGAAMSQVQIRTIWFHRYAWLSVLMRNLLFPCLVLAALVYLQIHGTVLMVAMILTACPVAGLSVLFAQLTGKSTDFSCKSLTLSTLASLISLPIILSITAIYQ